MKQRKDELITRARQAKIETESIVISDDILDTVSRMEAKIDVAQAETEIRNEIEFCQRKAKNTI